MNLARSRLTLFAAGLCLAGAAQAVRPGAVSTTAEAVCRYRAIAALHPDPKLRNPDELAAKLCPSGLLAQSRGYAEARRVIDQGGERNAAYFYVNARTHYFDAAVRRAAAEGATQVVVLGAGFDSRAYRFAGSHPQLRFFEVDLPATIEEKRKRVAAALGALPETVHYSPIDFNTQTLEEVLPALGYDAARKTLFLLEGVVMYVNAPGNDATFRFMRRHAAPGSLVVYDYVLQRVIDNKFDGLWSAGSTTVAVAAAGEPYVTGWSRAGAAAYAKKQGFRVVEDVAGKELAARHLTGSDGKPDGRVFDWHRIIALRVP